MSNVGSTTGAEIKIDKWNPGSIAERTTVDVAEKLIEGRFDELAAPGYDVTANVYRDGDSVPACQRRYNSGFLGTGYAASSDAGASVGESILQAALGGCTNGASQPATWHH